MLERFLYILSYFCIVLGNFFILASIIGFIRYKNYYNKLHAVSMFNIYGINFVLFAIGILSFETIIFFSIMGIIVLNTIGVLAAIHVFMRNAILNGVKYEVNTRDEVAKIRQEKEKMQREINIEKMRERKEKQDKIEEKKRRKQEKAEEKAKKRGKVAQQTTVQNEQAQVQQQAQQENIEQNKVMVDTQPVQKNTEETVATEVKDNNIVETENERLERENEELRKKIKENKRILRRKIEEARRRAFITRKPEEIEKTEKTIQEILSKYGLTEESLKDDDEEEQK